MYDRGFKPRQSLYMSYENPLGYCEELISTAASLLTVATVAFALSMIAGSTKVALSLGFGWTMCVLAFFHFRRMHYISAWVQMFPAYEAREANDKAVMVAKDFDAEVYPVFVGNEPKGKVFIVVPDRNAHTKLLLNS